MREDPGDEAEQCNNEENRIDPADVLESVLERKKENNDGEYLRCRRWQCADPGTARNLSEKNDARDDRPHKPGVRMRAHAFFENVPEIGNIADDGKDGCDDRYLEFHAISISLCRAVDMPI